MIKVLLTANNSVPDQVIPILIHLISATTSLHNYTVSRRVRTNLSFLKLFLKKIDFFFNFKEFSKKMVNMSIIQEFIKFSGKFSTKFLEFVRNSPFFELDFFRTLVSRLFESIKEDVTNQPLNQVASWCIGEYADVIIKTGTPPDGIVISCLQYSLEKPYFLEIF